MASAEFWYEFASTYSYPAALRVGALAEARGVSLAWRPFLLGPIFAAQGWRDSPFNIYPNKGRYMWRDLERTCAAMGVPLVRPEPFPQASLLAARVALALEGEARAELFPPGLRGRIRPRLADRRSGHDRVPARGMRRRSRRRARAGRKRRQQGGAQGRVRPGGGDRHRRRAVNRRPATAKCSGATIGSNRRSTGRRGRRLEQGRLWRA